MSWDETSKVSLSEKYIDCVRVFLIRRDIMKDICGIYCIQNNINGKRYIGLSKHCMKRWYDHYNKSTNSNKKDDLEKPLYKAMKKYGRDNFSFSIIEECDESQLRDKEIYWIAYYDSYNKGYNATLGGDKPGENTVHLGEEHGMAKLTEQEVIECRKLYAKGEKSSDVWKEHFSDKITYGGFQKMWHGKTWKHVMPEVFEKNLRPRQKMTIEKVKEVKKLFSEGYTCAEVFHYLNEEISRTTINDIYHGRRYSEVSFSDVSTISESGE